MSYEYIFNFILIGDQGVGKSALVNRFINKTFNATYIATIGSDFYDNTILIDGKRIRLHIWDTTGQERFRSLTFQYFRRVTAALLVYDITNRTSYHHLESWLEELKERVQPDVVAMVVGSKSDLERKRQVRQREGEAFSSQHCLPFMEGSAKTGHNVDKAFIDTAKIICRKIEEGTIDVRDDNNGIKVASHVTTPPLKLTDNTPEEQKKSKCKC